MPLPSLVLATASEDTECIIHEAPLGMPVTGVPQNHLRRPLMATAVSSRSAAVIIGPSWTKSAALTEISTANAICRLLQMACASQLPHVVALQLAARRLQIPLIGGGDIDLPGRLLGRLYGLGGDPKRRPFFITPRAL